MLAVLKDFVQRIALLATYFRLSDSMEPVLTYDFETGLIEIWAAEKFVIYKIVPERERPCLEKALFDAAGKSISEYTVLYNYLDYTDELPEFMYN